MTNENMYDVIIIGAGPAGMTAGIYTARKEMKTLIIGKDVGGQIIKTAIIENYPGKKVTAGVGLAFEIKAQAESFGVKFETDIVKEIKGKKGNKDENFEIVVKSGKKFQTKIIILAFGMEKRKLGLENEKNFIGKGISYCITCDGPLFKNKNVAVIGGGNAGAEAVEFMAKICPKVYWLEATDHLNADKFLQKQVSKLKNVEILLSTQITKLIGKDKLSGIKVKFKTDGIPRPDKSGLRDDIRVAGVFIEIGYVSHADWLKDLIELDKVGQIKINDLCQTNIKGIFAAGDCTNVKYKQIVVAEGMGAIAALEAYEYIQKK